METKQMGIEKGMRVIAADESDLGKVTRIWTDVGDTPTSPQDYFVAAEGGFLGIGQHDLYIPFGAVDTVVPGESVTVTCARDECIDLYTAKPEGIKKKEAMIAEGAVVASTTQVIFH